MNELALMAAKLKGVRALLDDLIDRDLQAYELEDVRGLFDRYMSVAQRLSELLPQVFGDLSTRNLAPLIQGRDRDGNDIVYPNQLDRLSLEVTYVETVLSAVGEQLKSDTADGRMDANGH